MDSPRGNSFLKDSCYRSRFPARGSIPKRQLHFYYLFILQKLRTPSILSYSTRPGPYSYLLPGTQIRYFSTGLEDSHFKVLVLEEWQKIAKTREQKGHWHRGQKASRQERKQERKARERQPFSKVYITIIKAYTQTDSKTIRHGVRLKVKFMSLLTVPGHLLLAVLPPSKMACSLISNREIASFY